MPYQFRPVLPHFACSSDVTALKQLVGEILLSINVKRVDRASAAETADMGSIPGRLKPKYIKKLVFSTSLLDVQQ